MQFVRKSTIIFCIFIVLTNIVNAKSLYVIQNFRIAPQIYTYDINSFNLDRVADGDYTTSNSYPISLTVHESDYGQWMFCSIEYCTQIERINLQTKAVEKLTVPNLSESIAGIVIDNDKSKLYIMQRYTNRLWSYSWNPLTESLTPDFNYPYYVELEGIAVGEPIGAYGLTLDEENDWLYVTDNNSTIKYYNTGDWSYEGEITADCNAIGIAVDENRHKLYYGSIGEGYGDGDPCLYQYNLTNHQTKSVYIGNAAVGIAVDQETGLVYITTGQETTPDIKYKLMTYDANLISRGTAIQMGCPTSLIVADIGYRAPCFQIVKDDNEAGEVLPMISDIEHDWIGTPYNWLYYNINWDANGFADTNVVVTDLLPLEVNAPAYISNGGIYDPCLHAVRWNVNNVTANSSGTYKIQVGVNYYAKPCGTIRNVAVMQGDHYFGKCVIDTNVGYYGGDIWYVDKDANGYGNGSSWQDAFVELSDAIEFAQSSCADVLEIWVANGIYKPVRDIQKSDYYNKSFELAPNVGLFGHFSGGEESLDDRDFDNTANETILEGIIGSSSQKITTLVKVEGIDLPDYTIVDGFTIRNASQHGIYVYDSNIGISNCKILNNANGVYAVTFSSLDIHNCLLANNSDYGLTVDISSLPTVSYSIFDGNDNTGAGMCLGNSSSAQLQNSTFKNNINYGIQSYGNVTAMDCNFVENGIGLLFDNSDLTIERSTISNNADYGLYSTAARNLIFKNNMVYGNGYEGLYLNGNLTCTIMNSMIYNNGQDIYSSASGINLQYHTGAPLIRNNTIYDNGKYGIEMSENGGEPDISNCIIYGNDTNDFYRENDDFHNVNYSCLQHTRTGTGNFVADPCFVSSDDLHLTKNSRCINAGNPNFAYTDQTDIDNEVRVQYGRADAGCDEFIGGFADYDLDGIVNFGDYRYLADSWRQSQTDYSIDDDNDVDIYDLAYFAAEWLWQDESQSMMLMSVSSLTDSVSSLADSSTSSKLMITSAAESVAKRPLRLSEKSERFYNVSPHNTISVKQKELAKIKNDRYFAARNVNASRMVNVKELLDWFDDLWQNDADIRNSMTETEYLEFRNSIRDDE